MADLPVITQSRWRDYYGKTSVSSFFWAFYISISVVILFLFVSDKFLHWFIVPVLLCGIIIGVDAVDWLCGRLDMFDPFGVIGLLGFHFFFLAPLLHVYWDYWMSYITPPPDWRDWLGAMAALNVFGLIAYRFSRVWIARNIVHQRVSIVWDLNRARFYVVVIVALLATAALQVWVYATQGGVWGYIQAYVEGTGAFEGYGWIFMFSESFPTIALFGYVVYARDKNRYKSWVAIFFVIVIFFVLKLFFGGLRGSRSNTVWGLFLAAGVIHFWIRPLPRKIVPVALVFLVVFMYIYGIYKGAGLDVIEAINDREYRAELSYRTGRTIDVSILADLGRGDIQAFILYRMLTNQGDYQYSLGRTYVGAVSLLIPRSLWPDRPPTKVKEGTEAQYGAGSYIPGIWSSSRVYGLAGETMLNFSPLAVPVAFALFGLIVGCIRGYLTSWYPMDIRRLVFPLLVNFCFVILVGDSDNVLFFLIKNGSVPFMILYISSVRINYQKCVNLN